jgi:hypothetical protein
MLTTGDRVVVIFLLTGLMGISAFMGVMRVFAVFGV